MGRGYRIFLEKFRPLEQIVWRRHRPSGSGDPPGKSSRFEIAGNSDIKAQIKDEEDLKGSVTVTINGKTYTGRIVHEHGHESAAK